MTTPIPMTARRRRLLTIAWYVGTTIAAIVVAVVAVNNQNDDMRCSTSVLFPSTTSVPEPLVLLNSPLPLAPDEAANPLRGIQPDLSKVCK